MKLHAFVIAGLGICLSAVAPRMVMADFVIGGVGYSPIGLSETVDVSFLAPDGGDTASFYSGLVKITITGTGESASTALNDAFYVFTDTAHVPIAPLNHGSFYQFAFDTEHMVGSPSDPTDPALNAREHILYDIDAGTEVTPAYVPAYRADHTYEFIMDTGSVADTILHFGVSNGIFSDNSGSYTLEVTQVIPSPGAAVLAMIGLGAIGCVKRRIC